MINAYISDSFYVNKNRIKSDTYINIDILGAVNYFIIDQIKPPTKLKLKNHHRLRLQLAKNEVADLWLSY